MTEKEIDWKALVNGASRAPSGDNTQPWEVSITGNALELYHAPMKEPDFYDIGGVSAYLALGAWLQNLNLLAAQAGYCAEITMPTSGATIARVALVPSKKRDGGASAVFLRRTNRFMYEQTPISQEQKSRLEKTVSPFGVSIAWIEEEEKEKFRDIAPKLQNVFWEFPQHRQSLLSILKLGNAKSAETGIHRSHFGVAFEGISAVVGLFLARRIPLVWKIGCLAMESVDRRNILHSGAVALLYAKHPDGVTIGSHRDFWLTMGMALETFWLETARESFAVQPFHAIIVIGLRRLFGLPPLTSKYAALEDRANEFLDCHRANKNEVAFMCMRIGRPKKIPGTFSLRKPFEKILRK